jgi:hypothetical protein
MQGEGLVLWILSPGFDCDLCTYATNLHVLAVSPPATDTRQVELVAALKMLSDVSSRCGD